MARPKWLVWRSVVLPRVRKPIRYILTVKQVLVAAGAISLIAVVPVLAVSMFVLAFSPVSNVYFPLR